MKTKTGILSLVILAATVGYLIIPAVVKAADSAEVTKLLVDAKTAAVELNADSADMELYTRSKLSWKSYTHKLEMIRGHVNDTGKLLAKLKDAEATGSPWQQATIKRIEPLLQEIADNITATIKHLNDNQTKVHLPAFQDFVKANYRLTADLEALIRDSVDYGKAKEKFEGLLEVSQ